jgi:hypothetical protein
MDPTHFGAVRHYYQHAAELLLDGMAEVTYPEINEKDLRSFRETYGASAYVCRFLHCVFSSDGFESSSQRARHESQHQRRFRCAHSSCVHFARGFVSRNLLNKHNENYHPLIVEGPSLAESLAPPPAVERPAQGATEMQGINFPQQRAMPPPSAPTTGVAVNSRTQPPSPKRNPVPLTPSQPNKPNPKKKNDSKNAKTKVYSNTFNRYFCRNIDIENSGLQRRDPSQLILVLYHLPTLELLQQ